MLARILTLSGEEVEETEIEGFVDDEQTYYSGNVCGKKIVQVQGTTLIGNYKNIGLDVSHVCKNSLQ